MAYPLSSRTRISERRKLERWHFRSDFWGYDRFDLLLKFTTGNGNSPKLWTNLTHAESLLGGVFLFFGGDLRIMRDKHDVSYFRCGTPLKIKRIKLSMGKMHFVFVAKMHSLHSGTTCLDRLE